MERTLQSPSLSLTNGASGVPTVVVVDDEEVICDVIEKFLESFGYRIVPFCDPRKAMDFIGREPVDIVLTDLQMGEITGVDVLRAAHRCHPESIVILITGYPTVENAVQVLKEGAYDYITKPFRLDELGKVVQRGLEKQRLSREVVLLRETLSLYRISEAMNSSLELPQVLQMILNTAIEEAQSESGCIILVDDKNEQLLMKAAKGPLPESFQRIGQLRQHEIEQWIDFHGSLTEPLQIGGITNGKSKEPYPEYLCFDPDPMVSSLCVPLKAKDRAIGALYVTRMDGVPYERRVLKGLAILASNAARAIENAKLYKDLHNDYLNVIKSLANAVEAKDPYTRGHSDRVVRYTQTIGSAFRLSLGDLEKLEVASILHDIGKIGITDTILLKPGGLTDEEYEQMKQHPIIGDRILQPIDSLKEVRKWVYQHHERHDGKGYPEGIQGDEIEFPSRILIVAEVFDALATERAYKKAWPLPKVIEYLEAQAGKHFDPEVVRVFCEILRTQGEKFSQLSGKGTFKLMSADDLTQFFKDRA